MVEVIGRVCEVRKIEVATIHAGMEMAERGREWTKFATNEVPMIISTNLLARGITMPSIRVIINYEVPKNVKSGELDKKAYQQRLLRCNHFGFRGLVINLISRTDECHLNKLLAMDNMKEI